MKSFRIYNNKTGRLQTPTFAGYLLVLVAIVTTLLVSWFAPQFDLIGNVGNWVCAISGVAIFTLGAGLLSIFSIPAWKEVDSKLEDSAK